MLPSNAPKNANAIAKEELDRFEQLIEKLKVLYEQYFQGFERLPPDKLRQEAEKLHRKYLTIRSPNTGIKFRAQTLTSRMTSYRTLWDKTLQQIEDGTYRKHVYRANLKAKYAAERSPSTRHEEIIEDAELVDESPQRKWGSVFEQYVSARGTSGEGVKGLTYEKLHDVLEKQAAQLRQKYQARDVEFKVVVEEGKAKVKAVPKK